MPRFRYVDRDGCVCGTRFTGAEPLRSRSETWGPVNFRKCRACASWCQTPRVSDSSLSEWYDSDAYQGSSRTIGSGYSNYVGDERHRVAEARARYVRDIQPWMPKERGRLLEVGCATGSLLAVVRDAGHEVMGLDVSSRFADAARQVHQLEVIVGNAATAPLGDRPFDMVLLLGTASNISDLPGVLERLRRVLRPEGTLLLNLPTADSWVAKVYGTKHWMFTASVVTFMTRAGCTTALLNAGFQRVACTIDHQLPSAGKLLHHTGAAPLLPHSMRTWLGPLRSPLQLPVPGVSLLRAVATSGVPLEVE